MKPLITLSLICLTVMTLCAQQPRYAKKHLVGELNPAEFKDINPTDGFSRKYIVSSPVVFDIDDDQITRIKITGRTLICAEGNMKSGLKNGKFTFYVMDSVDHTKRYKIYEQDLVNNTLEGQWKTFDLSGRLVSSLTFKQDSLHGKAKEFWIDGTLTSETDFINGSQNFSAKEYSNAGILQKAFSVVNGQSHGLSKEYYPDGKLMDEAMFKNGLAHGIRKYYYPSGKIWCEYEYKEDRLWNILGNYDAQGKKREIGSFKNGTGVVYYYNDDGTLREKIMYKDGIQVE